MFQYIVKRLLLMIVTLFGITVITFVVTRLTPGEPSVISEGRNDPRMGGYDSILEQNRRNLGLDKPMLLNFNFENRDYLARQAVADFCRPVKFWQDSAETNLRLSGAVAIEPVLERLEALQSITGTVDHHLEPTSGDLKRIDVQDCTQRLLTLLPSLAAGQPENINTSEVTQEISTWRTWFEDHRARWSDENVQNTVSDYLDGDGDIQSVLMLGGYAVPQLIAALDSDDDMQVRLADSALSGLTSYNYLSSPDAWETERGEVLRKWRSFHAREKIRFAEFNGFQHTINIVANTQFGVWMRQILSLDFGQSYKHRRSVNQLILEKLPITMILSVLSIFFSYLIAIPLGILSAIKKHSPGDKLVTVLLFLLYSLPSFWVGQMLLMTLTGGPTPWPGVEWPDFFPTRGLNSEGLDWQSGGMRDIADLLWHLVLPTICLTYGSLAFLSRQMRSAMLEAINEDYIRTARAKGLSARSVIFKHAVRNSLIPIITISAGLLPELIAGSIVIESIFTIPGMGLLSFEAILNRDYPVINAILFFSAALTLLGILLADLCYALVDPRISYD